MTKLSVNTPLIASIVALAVGVIVMGSQLPQLMGSVLTPRLKEDPTRARLADYMAAHEDDLATYQARFEGRSLFFKPKPPRPPRPELPRVVEKDEPPPPPPARSGPPATYGGPSILFVLGNEVWFHDGLRLAVGEQDKGVSVISADPPWSVRLGYADGEYDLEIFKRKFPGLQNTAPTSKRSVPGLKVVKKDE